MEAALNLSADRINNNKKKRSGIDQTGSNSSLGLDGTTAGPQTSFNVEGIHGL